MVVRWSIHRRKTLRCGGYLGDDRRSSSRRPSGSAKNLGGNGILNRRHLVRCVARGCRQCTHVPMLNGISEPMALDRRELDALGPDPSCEANLIDDNLRSLYFDLQIRNPAGAAGGATVSLAQTVLWAVPTCPRTNRRNRYRRWRQHPAARIGPLPSGQRRRLLQLGNDRHTITEELVELVELGLLNFPRKETSTGGITSVNMASCATSTASSRAARE